MGGILSKLGIYFNILFIRRTWGIGYRFGLSGLECSLPEYNVISPNYRLWYADPFSVKDKDKYFIFCEVFDYFTGLGSIGVFQYIDGKMGKVKQIIKEPFHMSYPHVFRHGVEYYMIPETSAINQIRLYKAIEFPLKWKLDAILAEDIKAVDNTILSMKDCDYVFSYDISSSESKLIINLLDIDKKCLIPVNGNSIIDNTKTLRPAGRFIREGSKIIRPAQYNTSYYGEKIIFYEVDTLPSEGFTEKQINSFTIEDIKNKGFTRIHTINRDSDFEVVDLYKDYFTLAKPIQIVIKFIWNTCRRVLRIQ